jgi:hypothetical protein
LVGDVRHYVAYITREHPICASGAGYARATRTNGEKSLILRAQSARKMSDLNEKMHKWDAPHHPPKTMTFDA